MNEFTRSARICPGDNKTGRADGAGPFSFGFRPSTELGDAVYLPLSVIKVAAGPHADDRHYSGFIVYDISDAVFLYADAPNALFGSYLDALKWARVIGQRKYR